LRQARYYLLHCRIGEFVLFGRVMRTALGRIMLITTFVSFCACSTRPELTILIFLIDYYTPWYVGFASFGIATVWFAC
jgi:hypothetical protein